MNTVNMHSILGSWDKWEFTVLRISDMSACAMKITQAASVLWTKNICKIKIDVSE